jgi:predicted  nucleic acid-binding Zn ribbon protein
MIFDGYTKDIIEDIIKPIKIKQGKELLKKARRKRHIAREQIKEGNGSILITKITRYCPKCDKTWILDVPGHHSLCPKCNGLMLLPMVNNN